MKNKIIIFLSLLFAVLGGWAQEIQVTGKVTDRWGKPVSGAEVSNLNSALSVVATDKDGIFEIMALKNDRLNIITPADGVKIVPVTGSQMNITIGFADEAVDVGFGIRQTMAESTGAISRATNEQIDNRSSISLANSLFGNVLGLTAMQNSGMVWEDGASLSIRGLQTLSNNGVLVLVDGFERPIQNITVEEVESVSILRDAAAVALYGYKGINGIVSVRTKRGKYKTREINVSYDHGFTSQVKKPEFVDSYTYALAMNEALANDGKSARYSANELNAFKSGDYPYLYPNVNWFDEVFRDHGASNIYSLSLRGGGNRMRYYTLLNLQDNRGFIKNADMNEGYSTQHRFSKLNIRSNVDIDLTSSTKLEIGLLGVLNEFSRPGLNSDNLMNKLYTVPSAAFPIKTEDGIWGGTTTYGENWNPVALVQARGYSKGHNRTLMADLKLWQKLDFITPGLSVSIRAGYDNMAAYWEGRTRNYAYASDAVTNWANGQPAETVRFEGGAVDNLSFSSLLDDQDRHYNFTGNIDYRKEIGKNNLNASLIYSYENQVLMGHNNTYFRQNAAAYAHYGYMGKYLADIALVTSASNKLAPGHKWGFSPTVSAAWVISKEAFMKDVSYIDFLKLRASAGIIQTDYIPAENYWTQTFDTGIGYNLGSGYSWYDGITEGRLPSRNSTREKAYKYNIGIDAAFLKGFTLTADAYYEQRKDIWVSESGKNSSVQGISSAYVNAGRVDSWGVETGLAYNKELGDFTLALGSKFTLAKNEIKEMLEVPRAYDYLRQTGQSVGRVFALQAIGYFVDEADIANSPRQQFSDVKPGDIKFKDRNNDGIINEYDYTPMGYNTSVPEMYFSFDLGLEWKGAGISASFQGVGNYTAALDVTGVFIPLIDNANISGHYYKNRWAPDNPMAKYPRLTTESNANNLTLNSVWLGDASFLKLRNCEIYYKLPASVLNKIKMKSAKVYVRGVDLLCFDKLDAVDPENIGVYYPLTKSVHAGFAIGF